MTIRYLHSSDDALLFLRLEGDISREENNRALRMMIADGVFGGTQRLVIDARDLAATEVGSLDINRVVSQVARQLPGAAAPVRVMLCARPDSFGFAMVRMFHAYASMSDAFRLDDALHADGDETSAACAALCDDFIARLPQEGQFVSA